MADCLFCKIVSGTVPVKPVYQDDLCIGFPDINPQAPTHLLFVPRRHIATTNELSAEDKELVGHLMFCAARQAKEAGLADSGYRLVMNCNKDAGQSVFHLHLHLLGGRAMGWPPG